MALFSSAPSSVCILRLSAIGDVCNTVATVQAIQRQWPETKITWVIGKIEACLVNDLPKVRLVVFDKKSGWQAYQTLWAQLRYQIFDALLHMQYSLRASIATIGIKARYKIGFDHERSQDFQTWFTDIKVQSPNQPHVLDGFLSFAKVLGVCDTSPKWSLTYSRSDKKWAKARLSLLRKNLVIIPGASKPYKSWHVEGYSELIRYVQKRGWAVILAGSKSKAERKLAKEIEVNLASQVTNLVGYSSLKEMLALLDLCDLVISPDTGPCHMASAMSTPVIGLYAHHSPERTGPYRYQKYVVSVYETAMRSEMRKSTSRPCWRKRVRNKLAMNLIKSEDVITMFEKIVVDLKLDSGFWKT